MTLAAGLRLVVVGLGVQGRKRALVAGGSVVATVDPVDESAGFRSIADVPLDSFDAALVCTPDDAKVEILSHLLEGGKHVLVEKPLLADDGSLRRLEQLAASTGAVCYTAYNHRFEPHLARAKALLDDHVLGPVYRVRMFYGNGTAADVRASAWRDQGAGVLPDLGSHLLDLLLFLLGEVPGGLDVWTSRRFENRSPDHVVCGTQGSPLVELEMSLLSWRNDFRLEIVGERGSLTVESLCKWGPTTLTLRHRVLPSGRPAEDAATLVQPDPTWVLEHDAFLAMCAGRAPAPTRAADRTIAAELARLGDQVAGG